MIIAGSICFCVKEDVGRGRVKLGYRRHFGDLIIVALEPFTIFVLHCRNIVTTALATKVVDYAIQLVITSDVRLPAWDFNSLLQLHNIIDLRKIHVSFTEDEAFQMYHKYLWQ